MDGGTQRTSAAAQWWQRPWGILSLIVAASIPLLIPTLPWLNDLPAHLSRYHVQAGIGHNPALARYFEYHWRFLPNLGVDLLFVPLSRLFGEVGAVRLIIAAIPALTVTGLLWIAREAHGRLQATSLFALPLAFSYPLNFGFVNSCLSVALALVAFGGWLWLANRGQTGLRAILFALLAPIVLVAHVTGFGTLGVLVGGATLARIAATRPAPVAALKMLAAAIVPIGWPVVLLLLWREGGETQVGHWLDLGIIATWLISMLRERYAAFDLLATAAVLLAAIAPLLARRRFAYLPTLALPAAILWLCALLLPNQMTGAMFVAVRLTPVACAIAILAVRETVPPPRWVAWLALGLLVLRLGSVVVTQVTTERDAAVQLAALDHIPRGSRVAAIQIERCDRRWAPPRFWHLASMATSRRDAYVNDQFETFAGQLLSVRPAIPRALTDLPHQAVLQAGCDRDYPALAAVLSRAPWSNIDYLWMLASPDTLRLRGYPVRKTWSNGRTQVYEVIHTPAAPGPAPR